jgi:pimeloyl-ACP methyl ester carboxylesterase
MKLLYLHGIGERKPDRQWLAALNDSLTASNYPTLSDADVIAPDYHGYLVTKGLKARHPKKTYERPKDHDEVLARMAFERRQAEVNRMLQKVTGVTPFGFQHVPEQAASALRARGAKHGRGFKMDQVRNYVKTKDLRSAILQKILSDVHSQALDDIVLVGHSLGSVVAIDLLDHLPPQIHVRRFVTIGSPANNEALHDSAGLLLKDFPYARVDDWSNFFSTRDGVTSGRGLATTFPGAQDFALKVSGILSHSAQRYLEQSALGLLVGDAFYPRKRLTDKPMSSDVSLRMTDEEASMLLKLRFGNLIQGKIKRQNTADRYRSALQIIRDEWASLTAQASASGSPFSTESTAVVDGELPPLPTGRWSITEAVSALAELTTTSIVAPYEIEIYDADLDALPDMAVEMGLSPGTGERVAKAVRTIDSLVGKSTRLRWWAVAGVGAALLVATPIGLAAAAPASAFGAAALTGGLAAFGPGGMVGGLATAGGLASTGAAAATLGAMQASRGSAATQDRVAAVRLAVTVEYARKLLDLQSDPVVWADLVSLETHVAAELNRLKAFSDEKAVSIRQLSDCKVTLAKLVKFMIDEDLSARNGDGDQ